MKEYFQEQLAYNFWAMKKTLPLIQSNERCVKIFAHILSAAEIWHGRIAGSESVPQVWPDTKLSDMQGRLRHAEELYEGLGKDLTDAELAKSIRYETTGGDVFINTVREILTQVLLHSHYHRGQIAVIAGKPTETDYILFLRDKK